MILPLIATADIAQVLVALGLGTVLAEVVRAVLHRKGMSANHAKTITDAAIVLVGPLQKRITDLESDLHGAETRCAEVVAQLAAAQAQVTTLQSALEDAHAELAAYRRDLGPHGPQIV